MEEAIRANTLIQFSSGTIKDRDNEYDLIFYAHFVPNLFADHIDVFGQAGFDKIYEKDDFRFQYYPTDDRVVYPKGSYRITSVDDDIFELYKDNIEFNHTHETACLPWIRYPRTKGGILIPQLIEKIFGRVPAKMVFLD